MNDRFSPPTALITIHRFPPMENGSCLRRNAAARPTFIGRIRMVRSLKSLLKVRVTMIRRLFRRTDARLAFVSTRDGGTANIWLLDLATHHYTNLTGNAAGNYRPSSSPDGRWIAFSSDRDSKQTRAGTHSGKYCKSTAIYIVHADGSDLRRLSEAGGYCGSPQWSPDGRRVTGYQSTPGNFFPRAKDSTTQIITIDVQTAAIQTNSTGWGRKIFPRY